MMQFPPSSPPPRPIVKRSRSSLGLLPPFMPSSPSGDDNESLSTLPAATQLTHKLTKDTSKSSIQFTSIGHNNPNSNSYPTPLPTSSGTRPASSSPTRVPTRSHTSINDPQPSENNENNASSFLLTPTYAPVEMARRPFQVRCPLSSVTLVRVPLSGTLVTVGRSSQSCTYALSSRNKLVSRVHVSIAFKRTDNHSERTLVFKCLGWNGCTVIVPAAAAATVGGQTDYFVPKGEELEVEYVHGITVDVRGERVLVETVDDLKDEGEETDEEMFVRGGSLSDRDAKNDKNKIIVSADEEAPSEANASRFPLLPSSPPPMMSFSLENDDDAELERPLHASEEIQTSENRPQTPLLADESPNAGSIEAVQDTVNNASGAANTQECKENVPPSPNAQKPEADKPLSSPPRAVSRKRDASEALLDITPVSPPSKKIQLEADAKFQQQQEQQEQQQQDELMSNIEPEALSDANPNDDPNDQILHLICNHLAFSRLNSTPLSLLKKSIPKLAEVSLAELEATLLLPAPSTTPGPTGAPALPPPRKSAVACIGVIERSGKDAAGKPLEREFYYLPEHDDDEDRRVMVDQLKGGRSGLRACRKTHKQYFWRKPAARRANTRK